jgi:uncharacterized protein YacL
MVLNVLRALFVLLMAAVGYVFPPPIGWPMMVIALALALLFVAIDILAPRTKKLSLFAGTFFGLIVGLTVAFGLSFATGLVVDQLLAFGSRSVLLDPEMRRQIIAFVNLAIGVSCCYLAISLVLQTKDDFRFIIPYVEFTKQTKGARPMLLDTSVLIDGRIQDIAATGVIESQVIVPRFVLDELQAVADSSDKLKRSRGRRGLDVLSKLQNSKQIDVILYAHSERDDDTQSPVDQRLMDLAKELSGRVLTTDYNLNKVAQVRGVDVININDLANALKPIVLPGEKMTVRLIKPGEEPGQGVGYMDDGTMVVVEQGRPHVNQEVEFTVTSALQTSAGRMIFGRLGAPDGALPRRARGRSDAPSAPTQPN